MGTCSCLTSGLFSLSHCNTPSCLKLELGASQPLNLSFIRKPQLPQRLIVNINSTSQTFMPSHFPTTADLKSQGRYLSRGGEEVPRVQPRTPRIPLNRGSMRPLQDHVADFIREPWPCPARTPSYPSPPSAKQPSSEPHAESVTEGPSPCTRPPEVLPGSRPPLLRGLHQLLGNYTLCPLQ